jgi:predicted transcriptional regulator
MIEVLGVKNADKLVKTEEDAQPTDPIQENQDVLTNKPVKAFMEQDHKSHIQVHQLAMQDPKIMQLVGQNPRAQMIQAAMMAHLNEHIGFEYRRQIQEKMGLALPTEEQNKKVSPEFADQLAQMAAQASQQLFQQNSAQAKQQQAQQQMQDPVVQMQMQELQLRQQELQLKAQKQQVDADGQQQKLEIEKERISAQERIAGMNASIKAQAEKAKLFSHSQNEGTRIGIDLAKHKAQLAAQMAQKQFNQPKKDKN